MAAHLLLDGVDVSAVPSGSFVVEIGSVRESGGGSSAYFAEAATKASLGFVTVDFSEASWRTARTWVGDRAVLDDGARFLRGFDRPIAVLYLDNFDYPYSEAHARDLARRSGNAYARHGETLTQARSAAVHFEQFLAALPKLTSPAWIIIDNTHRAPWRRRWRQPFIGKGERIVPRALAEGFVIAKEGLGGVMLWRPPTPNRSRRLRALHMYCGGHRARFLYRLQGLQPPVAVTAR